MTDGQNHKVCELPISVYCTDNACDSHSYAAATARALVARTGSWQSVDLGTCGRLAFIHRAAWYMDQHEYFDGERLVGAEVSVDNLVQFCNGKSGHARYGEVPTCTATTTEIILDGNHR